MRPAQMRQLMIWYNANRRRDNSVRPSATAPTSRRPYRYCSSKMAVTGRASIKRLTLATRALVAAEPRASRRPRIARPVVNQKRCPSQAPAAATSQTRTGSSTPCAESVAATMRMPSPSSSVPPNTASRPYLETRAATEVVVTGSTIGARGPKQKPLGVIASNRKYTPGHRSEGHESSRYRPIIPPRLEMGAGLKILVSAVQSRPSPPFDSRYSEDLHVFKFQHHPVGALDLARTCLVPRRRAVASDLGKSALRFRSLPDTRFWTLVVRWLPSLVQIGGPQPPKSTRLTFEVDVV